MSISMTCECGRPFETPEANAGRRAKCPGCGHEFTVPMPGAEFEVTPPVWTLGPPAYSRKAIASLGLGLFLFLSCLAGLPALILGVLALRDIRRSGGDLQGRGLAIAGIVLGAIGCLTTLGLFMPAIRSVSEAARRGQCTNNLKQIGLALHNYHMDNGCLPPAAITDKDGRPLLSWRVAILPYLEHKALHAKFHLDEPWDSPHNLALFKEGRPTVYACPSDVDLVGGTTGYQAVIGPSTAFPPDPKPLTFADFTDGLSTTILVGETRRGVPWTKPDDLPFDMTVPLSGLGSKHGYHRNGFNVLLADGAVHFLKTTISEGALGAILTRNGGEKVYSADQ